MSNTLQESIGTVMSIFPHMDFLEAYEYCVNVLHITNNTHITKDTLGED